MGALYVSCSAMQISEIGIVDYFISCLLNGLLSWIHAVSHLVHGVYEECVPGGLGEGSYWVVILDVFYIPSVPYYILFL